MDAEVFADVWYLRRIALECLFGHNRDFSDFPRCDDPGIRDRHTLKLLPLSDHVEKARNCENLAYELRLGW